MIGSPRRILFRGDRDRCEALIGRAKQAMLILENMMRLRGLQQLAMQFEPYPGALIKCSKVFGMRTVEIIAGEPCRSTRTVQTRECFCFPHFSFGVVKVVKPTEPMQGINPETGLEMEETSEQFATRLASYLENLRSVRFAYDVAVCAGKQFVLCQDVLDANFGRYAVGQFVLVTMATEMEEWEYPLDCDRPCLLSNPRFDKLMISPLHILPSMKLWKYGPEMEVVD
jgi:hypothetical protein